MVSNVLLGKQQGLLWYRGTAPRTSEFYPRVRSKEIATVPWKGLRRHGRVMDVLRYINWPHHEAIEPLELVNANLVSVVQAPQALSPS